MKIVKNVSDYDLTFECEVLDCNNKADYETDNKDVNFICKECFDKIPKEEPVQQIKIPENKGAELLNAIYSYIHQMQIMTTYEVVVQFSIQGNRPFYAVVMKHYGNGETRVFPLELSAEDLATKTDEEIISSTFLDIFEMMEKPQEVNIKIVKG